MSNEENETPRTEGISSLFCTFICCGSLIGAIIWCIINSSITTENGVNESYIHCLFIRFLQLLFYTTIILFSLIIIICIIACFMGILMIVARYIALCLGYSVNELGQYMSSFKNIVVRIFTRIKIEILFYYRISTNNRVINKIKEKLGHPYQSMSDSDL